mgnify:CR=1 FL=1
MDERTKLTLRTNLARDRAENLLARLRETFEQTQAEIAAGQRPDLSPEQIALGEEALRRAIASAERMVANLNEALAMAEAGLVEVEEEEEGEMGE